MLYKGKGDKMAITSESQLIDIVAIDNGCKIIEAAAADYTKCSTNVKEASQICTSEALSVEKTTMQPTLEELATSIAMIEGNITSFTTQIRNVASQIYAEQSNALAQYRAEQQAQAEAATSSN